MMDSFQQDLRYALRTLRASPAFTLVAVLSLALGIGANSAIFSLLDAVMLKYLPVQHPEELLSWRDSQRRMDDRGQCGDIARLCDAGRLHPGPKGGVS